MAEFTEAAQARAAESAAGAAQTCKRAGKVVGASLLAFAGFLALVRVLNP